VEREPRHRGGTRPNGVEIIAMRTRSKTAIHAAVVIEADILTAP
jgi:hypothetical protein